MNDARQGTPPWGRWVVLDAGAKYQVKRVEVRPGERLSYQRHLKRFERWMVVQGEGTVTLDGQEIPAKTWDTIDIPEHTPHRIENTGAVNLVFIEIQRGEYLGEDDIIRLQDDYGRAG